MYSDSKPETARERATRHWHNASIIHKVKSEPESQPKSTGKEPTKLKLEIMKIFKEKTNNAIQYYVIAIEMRRQRLLQEKLRRLKENMNE